MTFMDNDPARNRRAVWEQRRERSAALKRRILLLADTHDGGLIMALFEFVVRVMTLDLLSENEKEQLQRHSRNLNRAWALFNEHKDELVGQDKHEIYQTLSEAREKLNEAWDRLNNAQREAFEQREARRGARRASTRANIAKNEEKRAKAVANLRKNTENAERLAGILAHKESHLDTLEEKRRDAWSDDYRTRVDDWIEEEETAIRSIKDHITRLETWIEEGREHLERIIGWIDEDRQRLSNLQP